jgi:outer membrane protein assembly factor BamB
MKTCDTPHFLQCFVLRALEPGETRKRNFVKLRVVLVWCCSLAFVLGTGSFASAQSAGEVIWSVDLAYTPVTAAPRVGPSGDIYIHSDDLYAISPTGQIVWTKASSDPKAVDVGPDGTVYSGSGGTIFAYTPAGRLRWSFTEPPGGQGLMAGPTVGPDGHIYAVTDGGGLGALSLTPGGQLIWNQPGYINFAGTGLTTVPLTPTRLYFAEDVVPGCTELSEGLNALDLNGNLLWCISFSGVSRAIASPNGDALVHDFGVLYDYNPDGSRDWSFNFPFPSGTLIGPSVAPDGTIYIFHSYTNLWSLTATGAKRWESDGIAGSNFPVVPTISPDGNVIVFGTVFSFGVNGKLVAVNAANGAVLWTLPIPGPSAGMAGSVSFSNDGQIVYAPITEIGGVNKLLAVSVNGGGSTGPTLSAAGTCPGTATITVSGATPGAAVQIWASKRAGSTTIITGACSGTMINLAKARLLTTATADTNGNATAQMRLNSKRCGQLLQAVDLSDCAISNVATGP